MHVGGDGGVADTSEMKGEVEALLTALAAAAASHAADRPSVTEVLRRIGDQLKAVGSDLSADLLDEQLYGLESSMLVACWEALEAPERESIDHRVTGTAASTASTDKARRRSERALRDREIRLLLDLPRLELGG
jgi:cob(I)alamin adenosyltransferase